MLQEEKYELLKKSRIICYDRKMIKFLKKQNTVNNINSIDFEKLKIILSTSMLTSKMKRSLLKNQSMVDAVNSIDTKKIELILLDTKNKIFIEFIVANLLQHKDATDALNSIDGEKFKLLLEKGKFHSFDLIIPKDKAILEPQNIQYNKNESEVLASNLKLLYKIVSTDFGRFEFLYTIDAKKFDFNCESENHENEIISIFYEVLKEEKIINGINSIDTEKFELLINSKEKGHSIIMWLIKNENASNAINLIDIEKLKILLDCDKLYNDHILMEILKDEETVQALNSLDNQRINLLNDKGRFDGFSMATILGSPSTIGAIESMDIEKFEGLLQSGKLCMEVLEDENCVYLEDKEALFKNDFYYYNAMKRLARIKHVFDKIKFINIERFKQLADTDLLEFTLILKIFETEHAVNAINKMDDKIFILLLNMKNFKQNSEMYENPRYLKSFEYIIPISSAPNKNLLESFVLDVLLDLHCATALNFIYIDRLAILMNTWKEHGNLHRKILKSSVLFIRIINIDVEKLKIILEKLSLRHFSELFESTYAKQGIDSIEYERFDLLLKSETFNNGLIACLLKHDMAVNLLNGLNINEFRNLLEHDELIDKILIDLFGTENSIRKDKLKMILRIDEYSDYAISHLIYGKDIFNLIDLLDIERFTILVCCKKLDRNALGRILGYRAVVCKIRCLAVERVKMMCSVFDGDMMERILYSQIAVDGLNLVDLEKFKLLHESEQASTDTMFDILKNHNVIHAIDSTDIERFTFMINRCEILEHIILKSIRTMQPGFIKRIQILLEDENCRIPTLIKVLKECDDLASIVFLDFHRLKILLRVDHCTLLNDILEDKTKIGFINDIDIEKLKLLIEHKRFMDVIMDGEISIAIINSIDTEKLNLILTNDLIFHRLSHRVILKSINLMETDKFVLLFDYCNFIAILLFGNVVKAVNLLHVEKIYRLIKINADILTLLKYEKTVRKLHSMDIEKMEALVKTSGGLEMLKAVLNNEKSFNFVRLINVEKLKILLKMTTQTRFLDISECDEDNVKNNLNFAIALYKIGIMETVSCNVLCNDKIICHAITQLFPEPFPIDQMLIPSEDQDFGIVPSLKNRSIEELVTHAKREDELNEMKPPTPKKRCFNIEPSP